MDETSTSTGSATTYAAAVLHEDRVDVLHRVLAECTTALGAVAAALLVEVEGHLELLGATAFSAQHVEVWQLLHDRGPCVDVVREGRAVLVPDPAAVAARWPEFAGPFASAGFTGIVGLPLRWRGTTYGGLNLFTSGGRVPPPDVVVRAQPFADLASLVVLAVRGEPADVLPRQLLPLLSDQVEIERAKGVLSATEGIGVDAAFDRLRELALTRGETLTQAARRIQSEVVEAPPEG